MPTPEEIEAAAQAIYPLLQDILNGRALNCHDMPEFQLAKAALAAAEAMRANAAGQTGEPLSLLSPPR